MDATGQLGGGGPCDKPRGDECAGPDVFAAWIEAARGGCDEAFNRLCTACYPYLLLVAHRELLPELRSKLGASDLVQETLIDARQAFHRFHGHSQDELIAWVRDVLIKNLCQAKRHFLATEKRRVSRETPWPGGITAAFPQGLPPEHALARQDDAWQLEQALAKLPDDYRQVLHLRHWEEKSFAEIGECMQRSAEATRKLWSRALVALKKVFPPDE